MISSVVAFILGLLMVAVPNISLEAIGIVFGIYIIILFNPFASSISIVVLGGAIMMIHSVITFVDTIMIRNDAKEIAKTLEASFKEAK